MDLRERRELNNGFGTALSRAFEFAMIPLLFAVPGWLLDRWLGTGPFLALVTGLFGLAGITARMWFEYTAKMDREQAKIPGAARRRELVR